MTEAMAKIVLITTMITAAYHGFFRASTQVSLLMSDIPKNLRFALNAAEPEEPDLFFCCFTTYSFAINSLFAFKQRNSTTKRLFIQRKPCLFSSVFRGNHRKKGVLREKSGIDHYTKRVKTPKEPLIKNLRERCWDEFQEEGFSHALIKGNPPLGFSLSDLTVDSVIFEGVDFSSLPLDKVDFQNVIFRHCSLVNHDFSKRYFGRVRFESCNLLGTKWIEASILDVVFKESNLALANFSSSEMKVVFFDSSRLNEAYFSETLLKDVSFEASDLSGTEFFKTPLSGIDISSDKVEGLHCEPESLRGVIISPSQAIDFITYFGLKIKGQ